MKKVKVAGGRKVGAATAPTDLLVCFPGRQHLALMPKSICSPSRATLDRAVAARRRQLQLPAARSLPPGGGGGGGAGGRGRGSSPLFRGSQAKRPVEDDEEPQSPKVTCAGHIKVVRPRKPRPVATEQNGRCAGGGVGGSGRRWITVAEEIERLQEQRKKASWLEAFGIRRDALPFLGGALRSLRHKVRCFGSSLHAPVDSSTDDDDDDDAGEHERESSAATSVFSKWLMVLERSQEPQEQDSRGDEERPSGEAHDDCSKLPSVPPANALLLMRCRSAPAKGLARKGAEEPTDGDETAHEQESAEEDRDDMVFMRTAPDFLKLSIDIAKETWVVGGVDPLARSRSWKR